MRGLMQRIAIFMQGRYGTDKLNNFLFLLFIIIWFLNIIIFNPIISIILDVLELIVIALFLFRALSKNITKRSAENRKFMPFYNAFMRWFRLNVKKFKERKYFRYIKCPSCKAQLRVKNQKGNHIVSCPRCGREFKKKI